MAKNVETGVIIILGLGLLIYTTPTLVTLLWEGLSKMFSPFLSGAIILFIFISLLAKIFNVK